ncbi:MAG: recombinase family protein [Terriglobia bacterium]|nr:recombinase family protein [Terriglobia bacterium]
MHEKPVGIWLRVSTEDQARGESPEVHQKRARMYAEARGWKVREVYRLDAVSGKAVIEHPEAQRMLSDIKSGHITALIFSKIARLARNTRELLEFADNFRDANADMVSLAEAIDTGSPAGRLFFTIVAAMAQWEREEIASRVAAAVPIRAKMGKPLGGAAPFGYRWVDKKLQPDPKEAPIRALMYELFAEHKRKRVVARLLNERGYRTRNGSKFTDTTVDRLLRDPTARGIYRQNYTRTNDRTKTWEFKPESEWVNTPVEPVVSEELWATCNRFLDEQRGKLRRVARENVHLFSGYARCACGAKMYVWSQSPKYICPKCRNKIPMSDLEAIYRDRLTEFVMSPDQITAHAEAANETVREKQNLIEAAQVELKRIETEDDRLYQAYIADEISKEDFGRRHRPLSERRDQLEAELPRLQAELDVMRISGMAETVALADASDLAQRWDQFSQPEKRQLVETITDAITIAKEEVTIDLLYLPGSVAMQRGHAAAAI